MQVSRSARLGAGLALLVAIAAGAALAFGPLVRARVAREAAKRGVEVVVKGVRPGWFALVLSETEVKLHGVDGVSLVFPKTTIELSTFFSPREVRIEDGRATLAGEPDVLKEQIGAWRGAAGAVPGGERRVVGVHVERMAVHWEQGGDSGDVEGLELTRDEAGVQLSFEKARLHVRALTVDLGAGHADFDPGAIARRVRLTEADVAWALAEAPRDTAAPAPPATGDLAPPPLPATVAKGARKRGAQATPPETSVAQAAEPSAPLIPLPDLHGLRAVAASVGALIAQRIPEGALVSVEGLRLRLVRGGEERIALGPGPLEVERESTHVEITFSTGGAALGTPMSVHAILPSEDGDVELSLAGGQVPLSLLGLRAKALVDLDRATLSCKGRVVLEGKGKSLTFDGQVTVRGLAARDPHLAPDVVRGMDVDARARGVLYDTGELRLDEAAGAMGALRVEGRGAIEQTADHVAMALDFDVPTSPCESVLGSIPTALVPTIRGARMAGTLGARGRLAFDSRRLDDMALDYTIDDRCRLVDVPGELDHERFTKPFVHRIYSPDGKPEEETTGPTTDSWTDLDHISPFMQAAVLTTEDGGFFHHHGFSHAAIRGALVTNLKARRFVRGASTITMQLAKNLFLSRDKTLSRKLEELILTDYLEQAFSKDEMMELYLNVIEFGPNVYGITAAAEHYFARKPEELNLAECMFLSSILPQPVHYHYLYEKGDLPDSWLRGIRARMTIAERTGKISGADLAEGLTETVVFHRANAPRPASRPPVMAPRGEDENGGWQELN